MKKTVVLVWFRQDLRLADNPSLAAASAQGDVFPFYVRDDCAPDPCKIGRSSELWLQRSLYELNRSLCGHLNMYRGRMDSILAGLMERYHVDAVFWNRCYEPWHREQEETVKKLCQDRGIAWQAFNGNYLFLPKQIMKGDGDYYKVFTAYKNKSFTVPHRFSLSSLKKTRYVKETESEVALDIEPKRDWQKTISQSCVVGEVAAHKALETFIQQKLLGYKEGRDYPALSQSSRLSAHLHWGEVSPAQVLASLPADVPEVDREHFISELLWREFSVYLLYHCQNVYKENFYKRFDAFPWEDNPVLFKAWCCGQTGYPFVDAGMRELWQTGFMHNRLRMVTASFLVKNLNIPWQRGRDWFWDCLLDADLASNSLSWQWVAGSGVDAAPYFRIFNPISQGEKFDGHGDYTRKFLPELRALPHKYLFKPWTAPAHILKSAGVVLGVNYPYPIVDIEHSRKEALARYKTLR